MAQAGERTLYSGHANRVSEETDADTQVRRRLTEEPGNVFVHFRAPEVLVIESVGYDADRAVKRMTVVSPAAPLPCALSDD